MKKLFWSFFLCLLFAVSAEAQDPYFSQFYVAPIAVNPALTGNFNGKYRVSAIYRDQWRPVLDNQFSTYAVNTDLRFDLGPRRAYQDKIGVGILFMSDRMGEFDYAYNQINVTGAYHKSLNPENSTFLSLGVQIGMHQKTLNYARLTFSDQFDGTTGYSLDTNENLPENNVAFSDFGVGLNFTSAPTNKLSVFAGGSLQHLFTPSISFYRFDDDEETDPYESILLRKYTAQLSLRWSATDKFALLPRAIGDLHGSNLKVDAGMNYRFVLSAYNGTALQLGTYARFLADAENSVQFDAAVLMVGIEYSNVLLGFSYDANISTLNDPQPRSAFEISVAYLGEYENELVLCPKF